jgi:hypothetical protein
MPFQCPVPVGALSCQKDSYLQSLDTEVVSCTEFSPPTPTILPFKGKSKKADASAEVQSEPTKAWAIEFLDSVLFPEGGGQPTVGKSYGTYRLPKTFADCSFSHRTMARSPPPMTELPSQFLLQTSSGMGFDV